MKRVITSQETEYDSTSVLRAPPTYIRGTGEAREKESLADGEENEGKNEVSGDSIENQSVPEGTFITWDRATFGATFYEFQ